MAIFQTQRSLTMESAMRVAQLVQEEATRQGFTMNVFVVDRAGLPLAVLRNPAAPNASLEFAERKAYTAASFGMPTESWGKVVEGRPLVSQSLSQHPKFCMIAGGMPIKVDDEVIGALGVAGAKAPEDHAVAEAALALFLAE